MAMLPPPKRQDSQSPGERRYYYGWVIVAVSSLSLLVTFGTRLSFTVFFVALIEEFGWSRANTSLIFSVNMAVFALTSVPAGLALDRWGVRWVFGTGAALLAAGLWLCSRIQNLSQLVLSYGVVVGLGITILGLALQGSLVSRWFYRRRGIAIGLTFAGTGLGTLALTPAVEYIIGSAGWRQAYMALAALAVAGIPVVVIFLRSQPSDMGLFPDGDTTSPSPSRQPADSPKGWTMDQAVRTPAFWLIVLSALGAIGPLRMLTVHQMAAMVGAGYDGLYAASIIGFSGAITAVSFIAFGALSDRVGRRAAYALGSGALLGAIGLLSRLDAAGGSAVLWLYAVLLGLGEGSRSSLVTAVASDLFPGAAMGAISGAVGSAFGAGAAVFPWLAGWIYDRSGTYEGAFVAAGVAVVVSALTLWLAPRTLPEAS